jgi:hypothetical protein
MIAIPDPVSFTLVCHPQTPSQAIRSIDVVVNRAATGILGMSFTLEGDLSGLRIPETRPARRMDNLWRHTCFEVFVRAGTGPGYREFNFSPSGEWAAYAFRSYRDGGVLDMEPGPEITVSRGRGCLELHSGIRLDCLPPGHALQLGLSAVVEDVDGGLSCWALCHPPGRPDFHHTDAFAFRLTRP